MGLPYLSDGTATSTPSSTATAGSDYVGVSSTLNFADGQNTATITIQLINDNIAEFPESFTVTLSNPQGGAVLNPDPFSRTFATVNIADDDVVAPAPGTVLINEIDVNPPITHGFRRTVELYRHARLDPEQRLFCFR